jgi:hypothetical protein
MSGWILVAVEYKVVEKISGGCERLEVNYWRGQGPL